MIAVSSGWVNAHQEMLLPEMFLELTYRATEPGLQQDASSSATGGSIFSDAAALVDGMPKNSERYGTLEHGIWGLDGEFSYFDETPTDPGYVSAALSDASCAFATTPVITINLASQHTALIPGITIAWSEAFNEWATEFRVTAYNSNYLVAQKTVTDNTSPVSVVWMDLSVYTRITVEILRWSLPYHRARCSSVFLGIERVYGKGDLLGFEHTQTADLLSAALPKNAITFRLRNDDDRWNPDNPAGVERYLLERQEVRLRYGMTVGEKTEWIKGGTFWLSEWSTPANGIEASFSARDAIEFMHEEYAGPRSGTLYDIATRAFEQANLPLLDDGSVRYVVHDELRNLTTDFSGDDSQYSVAEVIQLVAHAGNCIMHQNSEGVFLVKPWVSKYDGYIIEPRISYSHPEYAISKPLKAVSVGYGDSQGEAYVASGTGEGEVLTAYNVLLRTQDDAVRVGKHTCEMLLHRKMISGEFRADVRLEVLDNIIVSSKYASNIIVVTEIGYSTTGGALRGKYSGRVASISLKPADLRSNEIFSGEV